MPVNLTDFDGTRVLNTLSELEQSIFGPVSRTPNCLYFTHNVADEPLLQILTNDNLAYLFYAPGSGHPGYVSTNPSAGDEPSAVKVFVLTPGEVIEIANKFVVTIRLALACAKEFFLSDQLPTSIEWNEL